MESSPSANQLSKPPSARRFSFQSARSSISKTLGQNSDHNAPHPLPAPEPAYAHRPLHYQTRGSRPPTTGPSSRASSRPTTSSYHSSSPSLPPQPQRSAMPSEFSSLIGTVKRTLSLSRKPSTEQPRDASLNYYGMTAAEDAATMRDLPPQPALLPAPTFHQIASGIAVRSNRPRPSTTAAAERRSQDVPRRSSMKRTMSNGPIPVPVTFPTPTKFKLFSSSSPSLARGQPSVASSSSSTTDTSSDRSRVHVDKPATSTKHKLSLSIATLTGRVNGLALGATNSITSVDSGVSLGGTSSSDSSLNVGRKAVRFSDDRSASLPRVVDIKPYGASPIPIPSSAPPPSRPVYSHRHSSSASFVERTTRFFSR